MWLIVVFNSPCIVSASSGMLWLNLSFSIDTPFSMKVSIAFSSSSCGMLYLVRFRGMPIPLIQICPVHLLLIKSSFVFHASARFPNAPR